MRSRVATTIATYAILCLAGGFSFVLPESIEAPSLTVNPEEAAAAAAAPRLAPPPQRLRRRKGDAPTASIDEADLAPTDDHAVDASPLARSDPP